MKKLISNLALVAALIGCAFFTLGRPDVNNFGSIFSSGIPTTRDLFALLSLLLWIIIIGSSMFVLKNSFTSVANSSQLLRQRWTQAMIIFVVGIVILGIGANNYKQNSYHMCCGHVQEAVSFGR